MPIAWLVSPLVLDNNWIATDKEITRECRGQWFLFLALCYLDQVIVFSRVFIQTFKDRRRGRERKEKYSFRRSLDGVGAWLTRLLSLPALVFVLSIFYYLQPQGSSLHFINVWYSSQFFTTMAAFCVLSLCLDCILCSARERLDAVGKLIKGNWLCLCSSITLCDLFFL